MYPKTTGSLLILAFVLGACSSGEVENENMQEAAQIDIPYENLDPFLTFQEDSLAVPGSIKFLNQDTVAVFDYELSSVRIYSTEGKLLNQMGKQGKGPGEFAQPAGMRVAENSIFVLDYGTSSIHEFEATGDFKKDHSYEGEMMGLAQTSVLGSGEYLSTVNGTDGYLLEYKPSSDSSFYFGEALVEPSQTMNLQKFKKQAQNGEVPDLFKNTALTGYDSQNFYAFLQSFSRLQRYDRNGELIWDKDLDLPINQQIFSNFVETNKDMEGNNVYPLAHASGMQITEEAIYILMNVPDGEKQMVMTIDKNGDTQKIYRIGSEESSFNNFTLNPAEDMLYLIDSSMGNIYRTAI